MIRNIFFDNSFRSLSEIIKLYEDGSFITDENEFNIPELLSHISDDDFQMYKYKVLIIQMDDLF